MNAISGNGGDGAIIMRAQLLRQGPPAANCAWIATAKLANWIVWTRLTPYDRIAFM
jgi:hypothetical protein